MLQLIQAADVLRLIQAADVLRTGCGRVAAAELTLIGVSWASSVCQLGVKDVSVPSRLVLTLIFIYDR